MPKSPSFPILLVIILTVGLGILTGFFVAKKQGVNNQNIDNQLSTAKASGISDKSTFKDKAEGILKEGGIDGEGNFHLERPGGLSQNVYLTSSTVDLQRYVNRKVRVWGATFQAQKAGWLMDVGYVELL